MELFNLIFSFLFLIIYLSNSVKLIEDKNFPKFNSTKPNDNLENKLNDLLLYYKSLIKDSQKDKDSQISRTKFEKDRELFQKSDENFQNINTLLQLENSSKENVYLTTPFQWKKYVISSTPPSPRRGHSSTIVDNYIIIFGGCYMESKCFNDLYFFDMSQKTWSLSPSSGDIPSKRQGHSAILYGSTLWIFGGSSNLGYLNDLYSLNLETRVWKNHKLEGTTPTPRANHGAVINNEGKMLIFGGYTDIGYDNNLHIINLIDMRFERPLVIGLPPSSRQNFGMSLYKEKVWIYGGFSETTPLNDLYSLDIDNWLWKQVDTTGEKPLALAGAISTKVGNKLYVTGGCDKISQKCFSETYSIDLDILKWKKIDIKINELLPRQDFSQEFYRGKLVIFGGCEMYRKCYNDVILMSIDDICPLNCSNHGKCKKNIGCACNPPYIGNDCSLKIKCKSDCNDHGKCHSNGKCGCFSGWSGVLCDSMISCPQNCTSEINGQCQTDSTCKCNSGYGGPSCQETFGIKKVDFMKKLIDNNQKNLDNQEKKMSNRSLSNLLKDSKIMCPNNCSGNGVCNQKKMKCECKSGFGDTDCSFKLVDSKQKKKHNKTNKAKSGIKKNKTNKPKSGIKKNKTTKGKSGIKKNKTRKGNSGINKTTKVKSGINKTTKAIDKTVSKKPQIAARKVESKVDQNPNSLETKTYFIGKQGFIYEKTDNCKSNCTGKGLCLNSTCFCSQGIDFCNKGFTSSDCSMTYKEFKESGFEMGSITKWSVYVFISTSVVTLTFLLISKCT